MRKDQFKMEVLVNGKPIYEYTHQGETYIEGRKNSSFKLSFSNPTSKRVLIVPSVDGLSPFDGKPAGIESPGMIVPANGVIDIPGWMVNTSKSAEFVFQDRESSYAQGVDTTTTNVGVIGFLVFAENVEIIGVNPMSPPVPAYPTYPWFPNNGIFGWEPNQTSAVKQTFAGTRRIQVGTPNIGYNSHMYTGQASSVSNNVDSTAEQLGVGWGQSVDFNVKTTTFDKGDLISQLIVFYDSRKNLERRGIVVERRDTLNIRPNPFPGVGCKPPAGWKP